MNDRIEDTNMPKITTYRTLDSVPILSHRGPSQLPIAEVAPIPKSNSTDQSIEKLAIDIQQQTNHNGLRKIESVRMPATSTEFNHVRYEIVFSTDLDRNIKVHRNFYSLSLNRFISFIKVIISTTINRNIQSS
jgi:hypothetical protein